ncbi:hypothetical protein H1R20_g2187, partial [Candolleomyces eurysporus]
MTSLTDQKHGDQYPNSTADPTYVQDDSHSAIHNGPIFGNVSLDQEDEEQYPDSTADPACAQSRPVIHNGPIFGNVASDRPQVIMASPTDQEHDDQCRDSSGGPTYIQDDCRRAVHNGPIFGNINHVRYGARQPASDGTRDILALLERLREVPMPKGTFYQRRSRGPIYNNFVMGDVNTYHGPPVKAKRQLYRSQHPLSEHE